MGFGREFVVFDTETTGMPPSGRLVELGALKVRGGGVVERFERLVYPEGPIPPVVTAIHGIKDSMVADAPTAGTVVKDFLLWADGAPLLGHNVAFDAAVLAGECARFGLSISNNPTWCTLRGARGLLKGRSHRLEALVSDLGLPAAQHHRAMADAEHTLNLLWRLVEISDSRLTPEALGAGRSLADYALEQVRLPAHGEILREAALMGEAVDLRYRLSSGHLAALLISPRIFYRRAGQLWMEALCHESCYFKSYRLDRVLGARPRPDAPPAVVRRFPSHESTAATDGRTEGSTLY